jgi:urease beta subunit
LYEQNMFIEFTKMLACGYKTNIKNGTA